MPKLIDTDKINRLVQELDKRVRELIEISETKIDTKIDSGLSKIETMLGGKHIVYIKQSDYDLLTEEERLDETKHYIITDAENLDHEHANKDFLDSLEEGNIDASSLNGYKLWIGTVEELNAITNKDPKTIYYVTDGEDEYSNIESTLVNLETDVALLKEQALQTLVQNDVVDGVLDLMTNPYQLSIIESDTEVTLPSTENFIKIHLYCKSTDNVTLTFPYCKWIVEGGFDRYDADTENLILGTNFEYGVLNMDPSNSYEIVAVYNTMEWVVKCIIYS